MKKCILTFHSCSRKVCSILATENKAMVKAKRKEQRHEIIKATIYKELE